MTSKHLSIVCLALAASSVLAQDPAKAPLLQRYLVEREIPGAGKMTAEELRGGAAKSNAVLRELGPDVQWIQTYVTGDKMYCVYQAPSEALIREHATKAGFPADRITPIATVIDPTTASRLR